MIEIMCEGGCVLAGVCMPYPVMCHLLQDSVIPEDGFVELDFADGTRGLIRIKSIIGFYETEKSALDSGGVFFLSLFLVSLHKNMETNPVNRDRDNKRR